MSDELRDKDAIRELIHHYCFHMDTGRFTELGNLFAADGEWITPYAHETGPASVAAVMTRNVPSAPKRVHYTMNSIIAVEGDRATARSNYLVILETASGPSPSVCGIYDDMFVRTPAGWRFRRRELIHLFRGEMGLSIKS
ncbi:MAG: nuclear transport factor 2 family protein [Acetobacteraceae bacterium]|nr:nuclear transport factor 2 family protein [Acetobacteraceae bacterium]